jgi:hypothetical protein
MAEDEDRLSPSAQGRFAALPPRVDPEDMVEEQPVEPPVPEATPDPNTEVAWRWGLGIAPGG